MPAAGKLSITQPVMVGRGFFTSLLFFGIPGKSSPTRNNKPYNKWQTTAIFSEN